jgi:hypothetical protein
VPPEPAQVRSHPTGGRVVIGARPFTIEVPQADVIVLTSLTKVPGGIVVPI